VPLYYYYYYYDDYYYKVHCWLRALSSACNWDIGSSGRACATTTVVVAGSRGRWRALVQAWHRDRLGASQQFDLFPVGLSGSPFRKTQIYQV
jgi:hypothetical protein